MDSQSDYGDSIQMGEIEEEQAGPQKSPGAAVDSVPEPLEPAEDVAPTESDVAMPHFFRRLRSKQVRVADGKSVSVFRLIFVGTMISAGILGAIFLINGIIMIFGFYNLYSCFQRTLTISAVSVASLESMSPVVSLSAGIQPGLLARVVKFEILRPSKLQVIVPDFGSGRRRNPALLDVEIPAFSFDRGQARIDVEDIRTAINGNIGINDLIDWYRSRDQTNSALRLRGDIRVFTWSFLFPLTYTYHYEGSIPLGNGDAGDRSVFLEALEFKDEDEDETDQFNAELHLVFPSQLVPTYLSVQVPEFAFGLNHWVDPKYPGEFLRVSLPCVAPRLAPFVDIRQADHVQRQH